MTDFSDPGPIGPGLVNPREHLGLVYKLASEAARRYGGETEDWVGRAWIFLVEAAGQFDPARGNRFSTYACCRMKWKLRTSFLNEEKKGRRRSSTEWAFPERPMDEAIAATATAPVSRGICGRQSSAWAALAELLARLPQRYREVLTLRAMGLTLRQVGAECGISKERVRRLEHRAIEAARRLNGLAA